MSRTHQIKLIYWYCYQHGINQTPLENLPTDNDTDRLRAQGLINEHQRQAADPYGTGLVWNEFHTNTPHPYNTNTSHPYNTN
ncbi:hypothetical protein [Bifidobacterium subtile]|uniref:Uncharacterized protein n=1 Tax=Bifidobacterium subtile TaxID=77635 RepID=A0A087DTR0_9BIFI|nr:hypothetical protein [Bifidobacterium subtile]KFI98910.1 hypothetical protein BISU_2111 [Bifidobacterium subtile]QOL36402.1 hypothetical protein BS3272_11340 [Bifidobacterium subtile]